MRQYFYDLATDKRNDLPASIIKIFLWFFSILYRVLLKIVLFFYQAGLFPKRKLPKPVISIGNITLGGAGKTPLTALIAQFLKEKNLKSVILARGYGKAADEDLNDEGVLLSEQNAQIPVFQDTNRFQAGQKALKTGSFDCFLLDDGFQHWRLSRDLDIVLVDAQIPFGNSHLIPRGILREPLNHLKRASVIILSKADLSSGSLENLRRQIGTIAPRALLAEAVHRPVGLSDRRDLHSKKDISFLKGKTICAFCAIGSPKSFEGLLKNLGADVRKLFVFMDHYIYERKDVESMVDFCRQNNIDTLLTTQKDAVKLKDLISLLPPDLNLFSLDVQMEIVKGKDEFFSRISSVFAG